MTSELAYGVPQITRGTRLRLAREKTGLTTRQFAAEIGVSQKTITDAEGDRRPTVRKILLNAYAFRAAVPVEWLETGIAPTGDDGGEAVRRQGLEPRTR